MVDRRDDDEADGEEMLFGVTINELANEAMRRLGELGYPPGSGPPVALINHVMMRTLYEQWCRNEGEEPDPGVIPLTADLQDYLGRKGFA